jgi:hypothetical protein
VAYALKGGDGEGEQDADAAAVLPHAVVPEGAPSAYCCGGERSVYCYSGTEEPKAVAPVGAPSAAAAGLYGEWRVYI